MNPYVKDEPGIGRTMNLTLECSCFEKLREDVFGRKMLIDLCGECKHKWAQFYGREVAEHDRI